VALRQLQLHALLLCDVVHNDQHCRLARDGVLQQDHMAKDGARALFNLCKEGVVTDAMMHRRHDQLQLWRAAVIASSDVDKWRLQDVSNDGDAEMQ